MFPIENKIIFTRKLNLDIQHEFQSTYFFIYFITLSPSIIRVCECRGLKNTDHTTRM